MNENGFCQFKLNPKAPAILGLTGKYSLMGGPISLRGQKEFQHDKSVLLCRLFLFI